MKRHCQKYMLPIVSEPWRQIEYISKIHFEWFLFFSGNCQNYKNPYLFTGPFFMSMFSILVDNKLQLFRKYKTKNQKDILYATYFSQEISYQFIPFFSKTNRTIYTNMSLNHAPSKYIKSHFVITILFTIYLFIYLSNKQTNKFIWLSNKVECLPFGTFYPLRERWGTMAPL